MGGTFQLNGQLRSLVERLEDRYEFLALLGQGGSGTVFEVNNRALQRQEALKIFTGLWQEPEVARRFSHEAMIAASLDHPNIVRIHAFGQDDEVLWYSMQLVEGPTLAAVLERGKLLDGAMLAGLAVPILDALAFSHERGVIHRDIKPANILFSLEGQPFLADFGIAKSSENAFVTRTGQFLGTPAYAAPEQVLGEGVDVRADLYSLGVTLYKAASGRLPFKADSIMQTLLLRTQEQPEPLDGLCPGLDPGLAGLIMRVLARNREDRFGSAAETKAGFLQASAAAGIALGQPLALVRAFPLVRRPLPPMSRSVPGPLEPTADLPRRSLRQRRWVGAGAALVAAALALWLWHPKPAGPAGAIPMAQALQAQDPPRALAIAPVAKPPAKAVKAAVLPGPAAERRPVVYPQLIGTPSAPAGPVPCAGVSVAVSLVVAEDGLVKRCKVLTPVRPECAEAARSMAMSYHFKPALDAQGRPVQTTIAASVDFQEPR